MNKIHQHIYTVCFAASLGLVCATLLTAAAEFTRQRQAVNRKAEEIRNILHVLKIPFDEDAGAPELITIFERNVTEQSIGKEEPLTLYVYKPEGTEAVQAVAIRFAGPGLWGPIKGFLALEPDYKTVRGVTFYEQEETPGLGGEIVTERFRNRFEGRQIVDPHGQWGIAITAGGTEAAGVNEIMGISGATMTCDKVEEMINGMIQKLTAARASNDH